MPAWNNGDGDALRSLVESHANWATIEKAFPGRSRNSIQKAMVRMGIYDAYIAEHEPGVMPGQHAVPRFDERPDEKFDVMGWLDRAASVAAPHHKTYDKDYRRISIKTDQPIAIMKSADWHFGGLDVDYAALREHVRFLYDAPGMYLQLFGDDLNLMIMHGVTAMRRDGLTPDEQIEWLRAFVQETVERGKLLSMGWGNHSDEFTERTAGFGIVKLIVEGKVPYFRGIGKIDLVLERSDGGSETYRIGFAHKTRFNSFMNPLHGNKRMQQLHVELFGHEWPHADEYVTAHTHFPAVSWEGALPDERTLFVKCGTFKTDCLYS